MARLPVPGADDNVWGDVLNAYLLESHTSDGTLKSGAVTVASLANNSITPDKINSDTPATGELLSYNGSGFEWVTPGSGTGSGESNTTSNIGTGGVGIYKQKVGVDFELKRVRPASTKITVTDNTINNTVDIDVDTAQLALTKAMVGLPNVDNTSDLSKPVSTATQTALNTKANSSVTVTGATSLTGGGSLTTDRTISLVNDSASPGNSRYYGTDSGGTKGYYGLPAMGGLSAVAASGDVTAAAGNVIIGNAASAGFTVTLPVPANGAQVTVKKVDSSGNAIVVMRSGVQIDDQASVVVNTQWQSMDFFSDGTKWYRI